MKHKNMPVHDRRVRANMYGRANVQARYGKQLQQRKLQQGFKKVMKIMGVSIAALIAVVFIYVGVIQGKLGSGLGSDLFAALTQVKKDEPFYMLLLGVDKDEERANSSEYGPSDAAYRSDSMILARIDPKGDQVTLVSIHRDTKIDMGSHGTQKINAAYSIGGPAYAVQVVSEYAGVPISHYAELDFEGFTKIVDTLGGIEVDVPIDIDDNLANAHLSAGKQTLNGEQALALSRARHAYDSYGPGDAYRSANQRMVIQAILKKLLSSNAAAVAASVSQLADSVTTDLTLQEILSLANQMRDMNVDEDIYTGMDPTTSQYINATWYEVTDQAAWKKMMQRVDAGLSPYESADDDPTGGAAGGNTNVKNETSDSSSSDASSSSTSSQTQNLQGTVEVLNATSSSGLAGKVAQSLQKLGATATAGNARNKYDESVVVYIDSANKSKAEAVAKALGGQIQVIDGSSDYTTDADVLVVLGTDMKDFD